MPVAPANIRMIACEPALLEPRKVLAMTSTMQNDREEVMTMFMKSEGLEYVVDRVRDV
ncbi:hypothetical protein QX201_010685 [Fusarium graminearum]